MGNLLSGVVVDWGFSAADIFTNGMFLVGAVAIFVLLGISIRYVPTLIELIRSAVGYKQATGKSFGVSGFVEEFRSTDQSVRERRNR